MQDSETEEFSPLSGRRISSARMGVIPWVMFSSILVFSLFAFVFATASFAATKKLNSSVNNNIYSNQGGLIEAHYSPGPSSASFEAGTVLSFCDSQNNVCPGLGPIWSQTLAPRASWTPAIAGRLVQLSTDLAVYAWVPSSSPNVIYVMAIRTSAAPPAFTSPFFANISLSDPVDYLVLKPYNTQSFVIAYDIHNSSYLIGGTVTPTSSVQLGPPVAMFSIPTTNDAFEIDVVVLSSTWILVSYGQNYVGASFLGYTLSGSSLSPITVVQNGYGLQITNQLSSLDVGASGSVNYFFQATGHIATLGTYSFASNTLTLSNVKTIPFPGNVIYQTVEALYLFNGFIVLYGVQTESLDVPLTISLVLQWATTSPYITAFFPSNLLETQDHQPQNFQISSCYVPSSSINEPGELFFSYVDAGSDRAKLIRAKVALTTASEVQILPSPPIDISTFKYTHSSKSIPPLVSCPTSTGVLVAYQYVGTFFSSFVWAGGYRFAGIAQEAYVTGNTISEVRVLRQGISTVHQNLQPGFSYYFSNSGQLLPYTSLIELFSPSSFSMRVGVAISDSELLIDSNIFEKITRGNF